MNESHQHTHQAKAGNTYAIPFLLILIFAIIELLGGIWTHSLALLSDAWHMFSDVFALGLAWFAAYLSAKPGTHKHANGQSHAEIAAAAVNALLMIVVVAYIIFEALHRYKNPHTVSGGYVMLIAFIGLLVNLIVAKMLHGDASHTGDQKHTKSEHGNGKSSAQNHVQDHTQDHNRRAAYLHVISDLLGSVVALLAGTVIYLTGWQQIDPILSIFISLLILFVTLRLIKDIWNAYNNG